MNGSAMTAVTLTMAPSAMTTQARTSRPLRARARPPTTAATMSASLCAPPTKWAPTSGVATPSHTARTGDQPSRRATSGTAQARTTTPTTASRRSSRRATHSSPETDATARASSSHTGPYGVGLSSQVGAVEARHGESSSRTAWS